MAPKGGAVIFLQKEICKYSVSSVEAGMGMERQIMCTFEMSSVAFLGPQDAVISLVAGASFQTPLGKLTALSQTVYLDLRGPASKTHTFKGRESEGKRGKERKGGAKMIYAPGARNLHAAS